MLPETKEDKLLLAQLSDRLKQCEDKQYPTNSAFLDAREQSLAADFLRHSGKFVFWGGYQGAERRCVIFLPDYLADMQDNFAEADDSLNPLVLLRVTPTARDCRLTHRDYLGALLALGIKRQTVGDIIVRPNGADIVILRDMADYLTLNYTKAGRHSLATEVLSTAEIADYTAPSKEFTANVPSLRLDCVAAAAFGVSRSSTAEAVRARLLAVNGLQTAKTDLQINAADVVTWRGKGKAELVSIDGKSRKDRIFVTIKRYI